MLSNIIQYILNLGAPIFVPFIMIIGGLIVKMKLKDAISSAITLGVAFIGMGIIIGFMVSNIGAAAEQMTNKTGLDFPIVDGGWTTMANISWAWPYAFFMFPLQIGINILMLVTKKTDTFNADLWNVWGKIFTAFIVVAASTPIIGSSYSIILAFFIASFQIVMELKAADYHQYRVQTLTGIPGVTTTHRMILTGAIFYPVDLVLRKIPLFNSQMDAETLRNKIGVLAENHVVGFILGIIFGLIARYDLPKTLMLGVQSATALMLFPMVSKLFMQALSPISDAISEYMNKKFAGRKFYVGLDWPILAGSNEIWFVVIVAIPITLIWAIILPYNKILPFAGIINLVMIVPTYLVTKGNTIRMIILATLGIPVWLFIGTEFAPIITDLGVATKAITIPAGKLISNSSIDAPAFTYAFGFIMQIFKGNFLPLIFGGYWLFGYVLYARELKQETALAEISNQAD